MAGQLRAIVYSRVSTDAQEREGTSLVTQERASQEYVDANGLALVESIRDTASGYSLDRPGIERVRQLLRQGAVDVVVAVWEWGAYLGEEALEKGASVRFASWNRLAPNTLPALAKVGANYMNSQLIRMEAQIDGYDEGIALDTQGYVSEASGENIFMVKNGAIYTPSTGSSILPGITRHSAITLAREMGYSVTQRPIPREALYIADEVFFTGSAAEITPIAQIDRIEIGCGTRGPITKALQDAFFAITTGEAEDRHGWLTYV